MKDKELIWSELHTYYHSKLIELDMQGMITLPDMHDQEPRVEGIKIRTNQ